MTKTKKPCWFALSRNKSRRRRHRNQPREEPMPWKQKNQQSRLQPNWELEWKGDLLRSKINTKPLPSIPWCISRKQVTIMPSTWCARFRTTKPPKTICQCHSRNPSTPLSTILVPHCNKTFRSGKWTKRNRKFQNTPSRCPLSTMVSPFHPTPRTGNVKNAATMKMCGSICPPATWVVVANTGTARAAAMVRWITLRKRAKHTRSWSSWGPLPVTFQPPTVTPTPRTRMAPCSFPTWRNCCKSAALTWPRSKRRKNPRPNSKSNSMRPTPLTPLPRAIPNSKRSLGQNSRAFRIWETRAT
mmetsp:Transcript_25504/g.70444  ORF Transcript_25504/g.70444 Transcript_25504/m.70444 type:complete len:300 (-) Transcript_25504:1864-2763(-)